MPCVHAVAADPREPDLPLPGAAVPLLAPPFQHGLASLVGLASKARVSFVAPSRGVLLLDLGCGVRPTVPSDGLAACATQLFSWRNSDLEFVCKDKRGC